MRHIRFLTATVAGLGALAQPALAQPELGQIEEQFQPERQPLSQPGRVIPEFDPLNPPPEAGQITFTLGGVNLVGNTVLSDGELAQLYGRLIGTEVSVGQVFALANRITTLYGQRGYPLSRAIIPAQEIDDRGLITLRIVEGFVDEVVVDPETEPNPLLEAHAAEIEGERPLSNATLERNLLLADDLPGISVRSVLRRSEDVLGGTTVILDVDEEKPISWGLTLDDRGSEPVGPYQGNLYASFNNLFHQNSETTVRFANASASDELLYGSLEHMAVLNAEGTRARTGVRHSMSWPGSDLFRSLNLETEATTVFAEVRHSVIRSRNRNLELAFRVEGRNSETQLLGAPLSTDRIRSLRFRADFDNTDGVGGLNTVALEISQGLLALGANSNADPLNSRASGRVDYRKATLDLSRVQQLGVLSQNLSSWSIRGSAMGQVAGDALLSSEECGIGGAQYGRAFDASALSGDDCFAASLEVRYQVPDAGPLDALQFYGFYDYGAVWNVDAGAPPGATWLDSAGFGVRVNFLERYSGSVEVAQQLNHSGGGITHDSPRVFVSISGEF